MSENITTSSEMCDVTRVSNASLTCVNISAENGDYIEVSNNTVSMWGTLTVTIIPFIFGAFGNTMTVLILSKIGSGTTNMFFMALSISDLFLLSTATVPYWFQTSVDSSPYLQSDVVCKLVYYFSYVAATLSAWLLVAMTVQRAVSVTWPHRVSFMCTKTRSLYVIVGITILVSLMQSHILYGFRMTIVSGLWECTGVTEEYRLFFGIVWSWVDLLSYSFGPVVILFISNSVLLWNLKTSLRVLSANADHTVSAVSRKKKSVTVTITLISVSSAYFIMTMPFCLFKVIDANTDIFFQRFYNVEYQEFYTLISNVINFLWVSYSGLNFYLYCLTGAKFRNEFINIMLNCKQSVCSARLVM